MSERDKTIHAMMVMAMEGLDSPMGANPEMWKQVGVGVRMAVDEAYGTSGDARLRAAAKAVERVLERMQTGRVGVGPLSGVDAAVMETVEQLLSGVARDLRSHV